MKHIYIILALLVASFSAYGQVVVNPDRELVILNTQVVDNATRTGGCGSWSFCRMMTQLAGPGQDPSDFTLKWLNTWLVNKTNNGFTVFFRPGMQPTIINPWPKLANGKLDLQRAPFRLLAIVNRIDLRKSGAGHSGEGRFVYGLLDSAGNPLQMTVIFEFKLWNEIQPLSAWVADFHSLGNPSLVMGTTYNQALEAITNKFVRANLPTRANGSAIGQVRTNELALGSPWELREFTLSKTTGLLVHNTVKQSPVDAQNHSVELAAYINTNEAAILKGTHFIKSPLFPGRASQAAFDPWDAPGITNPEARHKFAVNTCNGCHQTETSTNFLHISNRPRGTASVLSNFFRNTTVPDSKGVPRNFDEMNRRKLNFEALITLQTPTTSSPEAVAAETLLIQTATPEGVSH